MPKIVNHEERQQELVRATWRVISRSGIIGVTTREIAREAGVSTGVLAHYFADKEELLSAALRRSHQQFLARAQERTQGLLGLDAIRALMLEALPLDDERSLEAQIELNFIALALGNEGLLDLQHEEFERWWETLLYRVREGQKLGHIDPTANPEDVTHELTVLVEGLSQQAVLHSRQATPKRQRQTLDAVLSRIAARDRVSGPPQDQPV